LKVESTKQLVATHRFQTLPFKTTATMTVETVNEAPQIEAFTPLSEHQSQTPDTFFGGQPVLYLLSPGAGLIVSKSQFEENSALRGFESNGSSEDEILIPDVDIWVSSK
jgi:chloride channel, nucleotide-sensitive, 1A